jgi:hypothetical protein
VHLLVNEKLWWYKKKRELLSLAIHLQSFCISYKILVTRIWISLITKTDYSDFLGSVENLLYVHNWVVWLAMVEIPVVSMSLCSSCVNCCYQIYVCDAMHCVLVPMLECCNAWIFICIKGWILFLTDNRQFLKPCVVCYDIQYVFHYTVCGFVCLPHAITMCLAYVMSVELCSETIRRFIL